jgi:hypothetical protein
MYNSFFKYHLKGILGKKNDMWYFDNWTRTYFKNNKEMLDFLRNRKTPNDINEISNDLNHNCIIMQMREHLLSEYKNKFLDRHLKIALHLPPISVSPAANSWMLNLSIALEYSGIVTYIFWEQIDQKELFTSDIVLGIGAEFVSKYLDWHIIDQYRSKNGGKVWLQASVNYHSINLLRDYINSYAKKGVDGFYSFDTKNFNEDSGFNQIFNRQGFPLCSFTFSANPLIHFPVSVKNKYFDYIFLGSTNYDKIDRYNVYFPNIVKSHFKGIITGPGWDWANKFEYNTFRDRLLYGESYIGLNLHLSDQIEFTGQLNERAYILAAHGVPQILDDVYNIRSYFPEIGLISENKEEYLDNFYSLKKKPDMAIDLAQKAAVKLYQAHTTFHRIDNFLSDIGLVN